jgi:hypothetical protein
MSCSSPFEYEFVEETDIITSSQSVTCKGSTSIPQCKVPGHQVCLSYDESCWFSGCSGHWSDCYWVDEVVLWPELNIKGSATVNTIFGSSEDVSFSLEGPSQTYTTTLTIDSVVLKLTVNGTSSSFKIADSIECEYNSDGDFSATIKLSSIGGTYEGVNWSVDSSLLLCPKPEGGVSWLNLQSSFTLSELGCTASVTFEMPITDVAE